ncbi:hypothetical protein V2J09_000621 [Rumex salicifolius]
MASTPHCLIPAGSKPYQPLPFSSARKTTSETTSHHHHRHHPPRFTASHKSPISPSTSTTPRPYAAAANRPVHCFANEFSGKRSTRVVSKLHCNRPKTSNSARHTADAEEALHLAIQLPNSESAIERLLLEFQPKLRGPDDYSFLLREMGNQGQCSKAVQCYGFALQRENRTIERGKLASSMISVLGRLGKVELAKNVFDDALKEGFGNTVYAYSAMISAYGRSGRCEDALHLFQMMKNRGLKPNLVIYNAVIDACAKGGMDVERALGFFNEMLGFGVNPDRITFNSLLAVCSRAGLWELAMKLSLEMVGRRIQQDLYTYNTLLDAICKGGKLNLAVEIMSEMELKNVMPNVVTYSTVIDGYAKAGRLDEALKLLDKMKISGVSLDKVSFNTKLSLYSKLGRFEDALKVCREMESAGIKKDVVTYNALLDGLGKQGKYNEVKYVRGQMKVERVTPNLLTYSTLLDAYSKGGLYQEAIEVFGEFKQTGLRADVVLYSSLIDAFCKGGQIESAVFWLDEMMKEGIKPNVVTYNTIIDALGKSATALESSREVTEVRLAGDRSNCTSILGIFHKMHELEIRPNVVTFSAILNACSRCNSFEDASMLLQELHLFDDHVYGVAHGMLTGFKENVWLQALSLFDEVKKMDSSTASAFYNALTDVLWHFGQKQGAQLVVVEGKGRNVWENVWSPSCLDLHLMSSGAAQAMVHTWLLDIRSNIFKGQKPPELLSILTGWGKHSKVVGDGTLRKAIEALLNGMNSPFRVAKSNMGRFVSPGTLVASWLKDSDTMKLLVLKDDRIHTRTKPDKGFYGSRFMGSVWTLK